MKITIELDLPKPEGSTPENPRFVTPTLASSPQVGELMDLNAWCKKEIDRLTVERDSARAEVERLNTELNLPRDAGEPRGKTMAFAFDAAAMFARSEGKRHEDAGGIVVAKHVYDVADRLDEMSKEARDG